jgi:hypothetical protein
MFPAELHASVFPGNDLVVYATFDTKVNGTAYGNQIAIR